MELLTPLKILKHDFGNPVTIAHLPMTFLFKFSSMKREDRRLGAQPGIFRVGEIRALLLYFQKRQGRPLPLPSASFTPVQRPHKKIWESSESSNESTA